MRWGAARGRPGRDLAARPFPPRMGRGRTNPRAHARTPVSSGTAGRGHGGGYIIYDMLYVTCYMLYIIYYILYIICYVLYIIYYILYITY